MSTVIDASALIAFLRDEPGADVVENVLSAPENCYAHALNLCEVYYDFFRASNQDAAPAQQGRGRSRILSAGSLRIGSFEGSRWRGGRWRVGCGMRAAFFS